MNHPLIPDSYSWFAYILILVPPVSSLALCDFQMPAAVVFTHQLAGMLLCFCSLDCLATQFRLFLVRVCVGWELISFLDAVRLSCSRSPYQDQNTSWRTTDWLDFIINCLKNPISNNLCFLNFLLASISKVIKTFALGFHVMYNLSLSFTRMLQ